MGHLRRSASNHPESASRVIGKLCVGGDWACSHGDFEALGDIAVQLADFAREPDVASCVRVSDTLPDGSMPDALELPLTIPAELGPAAEVISELRDRVRAVELERAAERARTGRRVLGRHAVLAQSWRESPASREPRRNLRPRVASRSKWARIEALLRNRAFAIEYASARERWRDGVPAVFPPGTYWLQRFASVPVLET